MNNRIKAFYGRQSVDRKDSISIDSQLEFAMHELRGESFREYRDKGYSGKNTDRPQFQSLVRDIENGIISDVVVYKLDRISRSIIDFANMMELFQKYKVEFISATEKFDTSTPMGRAMLNICIVFAQLERETIQRRVKDAYYSRCEKGLYMGGHTPYGYKLENTVMDGISTKALEIEDSAANHVRQIFEMYSQQNTSFGDISRYFTQNGIRFRGGEFGRHTISFILRNPVYAQADLELYEFFKSQGTNVINDVADFAGTNGCYLFRGRDTTEPKFSSLKDHILVIAPHEGIVPAETWLACRKKLMNNQTFGGTHKAKNSWLAGKIKCGKCNAGLMATIKNDRYGYFNCRRQRDNNGCEGSGTLHVRKVEKSIYEEMLHKMAEYHTLTSKSSKKANPKMTALNISLAQVKAEIEKLLNTLAGANPTLMSYANSKIEELDNRKQSIEKQIADLTAETVSPKQIERISGYLDGWESISFDDKRLVADGLISHISATCDDIVIDWKI
ncbi:MAG: recombinase family protein [Dehalococcoidia bacterium]|nr:recombinase family protein [Dehalococcoidia bacterium]